VKILTAICLVIALARIGTAETLAPFVFVMIDSKTEARFGNLPFNRALVAKAVDQLGAAGAKGVVIKFFYDLPSGEEKDRALELSICQGKVALQACLNDGDGSTNSMESKFLSSGKPAGTITTLFAGDKGYIPLRRFSRCAQAVGFVDSTAEEIPLFEIYQGAMVKSLSLVALEMASGQKAEVDAAGFVRLGKKRMEMMHRIRFPATNSLSYIPFHEVIDDKAKGWQGKIKGAVVILGYDGKNIHSIETPIGKLGAHRFFINGLRSLVRSFEEGEKEGK